MSYSSRDGDSAKGMDDPRGGLEAGGKGEFWQARARVSRSLCSSVSRGNVRESRFFSRAIFADAKVRIVDRRSIDHVRNFLHVSFVFLFFFLMSNNTNATHISFQ